MLIWQLNETFWTIEVLEYSIRDSLAMQKSFVYQYLKFLKR